MSTKATSENAVATEEHFEFAPIENEGKVNIANHSHSEETVLDHIHTVTVKRGRAVHCTCLGHTYNATRKHLDAVEARQDVLAVADPSLCSTGDEHCPGPAAIDVESGPKVGDKFACLTCWNAAFKRARGEQEGER